MLKSNYLGLSIDLARNNVIVLLGQGVSEGVPQSRTTQQRTCSVLDGTAGGPGELVAEHLSDVLFEGKELNRGLKKKCGSVPLVIEISSGIVFAERNKEAMGDKGHQKERAAISQDPLVRAVPARCATAEERLHAHRLYNDKRNHRRRGVREVAMKLRGDVI